MSSLRTAWQQQLRTVCSSTQKRTKRPGSAEPIGGRQKEYQSLIIKQDKICNRDIRSVCNSWNLYVNVHFWKLINPKCMHYADNIMYAPRFVKKLECKKYQSERILEKIGITSFEISFCQRSVVAL